MSIRDQKFPRMTACLLLMLSSPAVAFAQVQSQTPPSAFQKLMAMVPMFIMVFLIFYLLVHLPEQKKEKDHIELMQELKKGDKVVTSAGLIGRVAGIEKEYILLEVANNVKLKVERAHVSGRKD